MNGAVKPASCPICNRGKDLKPVMDYREFFLYECNDCKVQFFLEVKNPGADWYENTSDYGIKDMATPKVYRGFHKKFLEKYGYQKSKSILELGCGSGEFLHELQKRGWNAYGIDFDKKGIEVAKKHFNLQNVFALSFEEFFKNPPLEKFDYVVFFEIIEHLEKPLEFIRQAKQMLKQGGTMVLSTPSRERFLANWNAWDFPPHHLARFNRQSLDNIFKKINFRITDFSYVEPLKLLIGAVDGRFRSGLVSKASAGSSKNKQSLLFSRGLYLLAKIKFYILGVIPGTCLWSLGKLTGRANGIMFIELKEN